MKPVIKKPVKKSAKVKKQELKELIDKTIQKCEDSFCALKNLKLSN